MEKLRNGIPDYDWDSRSSDHGMFYGYGLLFHMTQLISRNNTKSHRRLTKPLSVNIRADENTSTSLVCNANNTAESCVNIADFVEWDSNLHIFMIMCFLCACLFLLQFGLFWSFFQVHLVYFRETKVATFYSSRLRSRTENNSLY